LSLAHQAPRRTWVRSNGRHGDGIVQILFEQDVYRVDLSFVSSHNNVERGLLWPGSIYPTHGLPWSSVGTPPSTINLRTNNRLAPTSDDDLLHRDMLARVIATRQLMIEALEARKHR
jgi:hypothetical protein